MSHVLKYFRAEEDPKARLPKTFIDGFLEVCLKPNFRPMIPISPLDAPYAMLTNYPFCRAVTKSQYHVHSKLE